MRILLISADFPPVQSGEATHCFHMARHLSCAGLDVHVLTSRIPGIDHNHQFTVHPLMRSWSWFEYRRCVSFVRRCSPNGVLLIFLGAMYRHHPMITYTLTVLRSVLPSARCVTQFENLGMDTWAAPVWTRLMRRLMSWWVGASGTDYQYGTLLRDSHALIFLSDAHRAEMAALFPPVDEKSHLIPPPPTINVCHETAEFRDTMRAGLNVGADDFLLLFFGYVYREKGIDVVLRALERLTSRGRRVRLAVVGGPMGRGASSPEAAKSRQFYEEMKELANRLAIDDRVNWVGSVAGDGVEVSKYFFAADACVLPFDSGVHLNNSSFSVAVAHGLPIISTRASVVDPAFVDGENVLLCPPKNPAAMADAIGRLMDDAELRDRLAAGARRLAREWFSWERVVEKTLAAIGAGVGEQGMRPIPSDPDRYCPNGKH